MDRVASVSPASSPRWALTGRIVTMDARSTVVGEGTVWIKDGPTDKVTGPAAPISSVLEPVALDPLTVADDPGYLERVAAEKNLPAWMCPGLKRLYQV